MAVKGAVFTSEYLLLLGAPQALTTKQDSKKERNQKRHHSLAWLASHAPFFLAWLARNGNKKLLDVGSCVALVQPFVLEVVVIVDLNNRRLVLRYRRCSLSRSWLQPLQFWGKVLNIRSIGVVVNGDKPGVTLSDYPYAFHMQTYSDCLFIFSILIHSPGVAVIIVPLHRDLRYHCTIQSATSTTILGRCTSTFA